MSLVKFKIDQLEEMRNYYYDKGYVIVSDLSSSDLIDEFLEEYEKFKKKSNYLINTQDTNRPEILKVNKEGFIENSIMDPLDIVFAGDFAKKVQKIIVNDRISKIVSTLTNVEENVLWQSMFFDKSTGTVVHQDSYYLDSDPPGKLVGLWFALEDIHEDAGCFYVVPESNKIGKVLFEGLDHESYVKNMLKFVEDNDLKKMPCLLNKGDVLFWNSMTLHGSFENVNPKLSRKSFTSHFIPANEKRNKTKVPDVEASKIDGILMRKKKRLKERLRYGKMFYKYVVNTKLRNKLDMEMKSSKY